MSRFVLLEHQFPPGSKRSDHLDLMVEPPDSAANGGAEDPNGGPGRLWTWELVEAFQEGRWPVRRLVDHRAIYLDYEGPISGDRGTVSQKMSGIVHWEGIEPARLAARLISLSGEVWLCRWTKMDEGEAGWLTIESA